MYDNIAHEVQRIEEALEKAEQEVYDLRKEVEALEAEKDILQDELDHRIEADDYYQDQYNQISAEFRLYKREHQEYEQERPRIQAQLKDGEDAIRNHRNLMNAIKKRDLEIGKLKVDMMKLEDTLVRTNIHTETPIHHLVRVFHINGKDYVVVKKVDDNRIIDILNGEKSSKSSSIRIL